MKTILTALFLMTVPFVAVPAAADWGCGSVYGVSPPVFVDACYGDTNADNPYAACDGDWQDLYEANTGTYYQSCMGADGSTNLYVCPASFSYSYESSACIPVNA